MPEDLPTTSLPRPESPQGTSSPLSGLRTAHRRWRRILGFALGFVLLAAAVVAMVQNLDPVRAALSKVTSGDWWLLPVVLLLPFLHLPLTGAIFWAATPRDADGRPRVALGEMTALIATANLANYLPLRPGMLARIAYHRAVNNIPIVESAKILGSVVAAGLVAATLFLAASMAAARATGGSLPGLPVAVLLLPIAIGLLGRVYFNRSPVIARWWFVLTLRYVDLGIWAFRYAIAFWAIGLPLTPAQAAIYAVIANAAMLIPLAGNGLGIREWVVGLAGPLLPAMVLGVSTVKQQGLTADLLNRAAEIVMSLVAGSIAAAWITRHLKQRAASASNPCGAGGPPVPVSWTPSPSAFPEPTPSQSRNTER